MKTIQGKFVKHHWNVSSPTQSQLYGNAAENIRESSLEYAQAKSELLILLKKLSIAMAQSSCHLPSDFLSVNYFAALSVFGRLKIEGK